MSYSEEEWRELFDAYRLEVIRAGFGTWDTSACADLAGESVQVDFRKYADRFAYLLKTRGHEYRRRLLDQLGELMADQEGRPIRDVRLQYADGTQAHLLELPIGSNEAKVFADYHLTLFSDAELPDESDDRPDEPIEEP